MLIRRTAFGVALLTLSMAFSGSSNAASQLEISSHAAEQMVALKQLSLGRDATDQKMDSRLYWAVLKSESDSRMALFPDLRIQQPEADGLLPIEVIATNAAGVKAVMAQVAALDGVVTDSHYGFRTVSARVHIQDLRALVAMNNVVRVRQHIPAYTASMKAPKSSPTRARKVPTAVAAMAKSLEKGGINVSEGDTTHGAATARSAYGVTGAGVKICVLSDGVDSLATAVSTGDLPAGIDVLAGQAGSGDEGTAMLEIVHDLAPAAQLGFATAFTSEASFAQNILDLASAGCNVIVDDIIYLDESPFQDGPVAQSVNTVTAAGVLYFSSAGNEGNKSDATSGTWEGNFLANGTPASLAGAGPAHNFGDGGQSILVEVGGGNPPLLIWAEHYDLATGTASTDFDLYDLNAGLTTIFDASTDTQDGSGGDDFPIEFIGGGTFAGERLVVTRFAAGATSSVPAFNLILFRGELDDAVTTSGTTRGHSAAADAYSVAATPAAAEFGPPTPPGPFPGLFTAANAVESFSADGPRRVLLSPTGVELTPGNRTISGGVVRQKPNITAADGVATSAPGFNPFYGTSAAAPHAAAIAGLIKSAVPAITPAQVRTALLSSAIDIEAAGTDRDSGVGIIMAGPALLAAGATPQAVIAQGTAVPTEISGDGDGAIEPNEDYSLSIPLENIGAVAATAVTAVLTSSTPGVSVYQANSAYADLAPAATGPNLAGYLFKVGGAVPCGASLDFTLTVTYTGGSLSPQAFNFSLSSGAAGAPVAFAYAGPAVPIPDSAGANVAGLPGQATLPVALAGNIVDVDLSIDGATCSNAAGSTTVGMDHSFINDLEITLISPAGTTSKVIARTDSGGNNLCQTILDDESAGTSIQSVLSAQAPFTGNFKPANALSVFDSEAANGNWILQAEDFFVGDTGSIRAFTVTLTPALCDAPVQPANLTATKTVSGSFLEGSLATYSIVLTNSGTGIQPNNPTDEFSDALPAQLSVGTPTATAGTVSGGGVNPVTWNGLLLPGASVTITVPATINAGTGGQMVSNQGTLGFDADRDGSNESAGLTDDPGVAGATDPTVFQVVSIADLSITLTDAPDPVTAGGAPLVYTATVSNAGPNSANAVTVTMPVPANTTFVSGITTGGGSCSGAPIVCTFPGSIAAAGSGMATITVQVSAGVPAATIINATATAATSSTDPNPANNTANATTTVVTDANLQVSLSASTLEALINEPVTFTATSLNLGPSDAQNLSITITLTPDFRYTGHTATGATCTTPQVGTTGAITCVWAGTTVVNASRVLQVVAYSNNEGATAVNASSTSDTSDSVTANNVGNVSVQVGFAIEGIPTMNSYGLILLGLMLGLLGFVAVRRDS